MGIEASPVLDLLQSYAVSDVEFVILQELLDYFGLTDRVAASIVGGMPDIIEAMRSAGKVISL